MVTVRNEVRVDVTQYVYCRVTVFWHMHIEATSRSTNQPDTVDKILSLHSLAHSATKITFNFFRTYGLRYVIAITIYVYSDVD